MNNSLAVISVKSTYLSMIVLIVIAIIGIISINQTLQLEPQSQNKPQSSGNEILQRSMIVSVEDRHLENKILPISVTEQIIHLKPVDEVKIWRIFPFIIEDGERERVIGLNNPGIESQYGLKYSFNVFDENQNEILDLDSNRGTINYRDALGYVMTICSDNTREEANFSPEWIVPLKPNFTSNVYVKYSEYALVPKNNEYRLKFSSFFDTQIILPDNTIVISNKTKSCSPFTGEWKTVNFFDIVFRLT